jgi:hypothetical protein
MHATYYFPQSSNKHLRVRGGRLLRGGFQTLLVPRYPWWTIQPISINNSSRLARTDRSFHRREIRLELDLGLCHIRRRRYYSDWSFGTPSNQKRDENSNLQATIGVAINSTFINALHTAGNISSNAYSLFWGDEFTNEPCDGAFTLGGYDEAILGDSMVTKGFTRSEERCAEGMIVEVTHMRLNHQEGPTVDLLDGLGALNVCVIPSLRAIMAVPGAYGEKLIASMGAVRLDNGTNIAGSTKSGLRLLPYAPILEPDSA